MLPFEELECGMYLSCHRSFTDVLVKGGVYKVVGVDTINSAKRYVDIRAEDNHLFRVYRKDYEAELFEYLAKSKVEKKKLKYTPPKRVQLQKAQALRYEIEYLLDSIRYSNDLVENEKDFLRLHEIHEELKALDYLVIHKEIESHICWEKEDAI